MKNTILLVLLLLLGSKTAFAKIWRLNNNNGVTADFTTLQAAHDGASSGDTLHIEGSATSYGNLTSTKELVILGPGYFLDQNQNTQALQATAYVSSITFNNGSAGSVVMGLDFRGGSISVFENDITIKRNKFASYSGQAQEYSTGAIRLYYVDGNSSDGVSNIVISQNYAVNISAQYDSKGLLITNNYLALGLAYGENSTSPVLHLHTETVALIQNNIFRSGKVIAYNSNITNNIMVTGSLEGTGNMLSNNISNSTQFGTANGNQSNVDMSTVFVGISEGISQDGQWKLKVGSPAIGAGYGSTAQNPIDAGMFSNHTPYVLSGIPPVPSIYFFDSQPVGSNTDPIDVIIKVKSNQ